MMMNKTSLRRHLRDVRRAYVARMSATDRARTFSILPSPIKPLFAHRPVVAGYAAVAGECNVMTLLGQIDALGCPVALPWFANRSAPMQFKLWMPGTALSPAPFGGGQPEDAAQTVDPAVLLMPLIGFDRAGNRLGQGGGHYDRLLAQHADAVAVGVGWSVQEVTEIPTDPWDIPLDHILTEREWITPMKAST